MPLAKRALVVVGGLVAIGVADDGLLAVAAGPAGLLDDAVAGGDDRRSDRGRPVDAGVHADIAEDRMSARAEAGAELAVGQRIAQQELLGAAAVLVEIVGAAVLHLEAVEVARRAAEGRRDIEEFGIVRSLVVAVGLREQHFEAVGGVETRLEVDIGGEQLDQLLGHRLATCRRNRRPGRCRHRRWAGCRATATGCESSNAVSSSGIGLRLLRRHILAAVVERDGDDVLAAVVDAGAHDFRLLRRAPRGRRAARCRPSAPAR